MLNTCSSCKLKVDEWNTECGGCGFTLVMEPDEKIRARYLRGPSLGALLFTQGWTFGSRLYVWFLISLIPIAGVVALFACLFFGRRWSWKAGGWTDWEEFRARMRLLDLIATVWIVGLIISWLFLRKNA